VNREQHFCQKKLPVPEAALAARPQSDWCCRPTKTAKRGNYRGMSAHHAEPVPAGMHYSIHYVRAIFIECIIWLSYVKNDSTNFYILVQQQKTKRIKKV